MKRRLIFDGDIPNGVSPIHELMTPTNRMNRVRCYGGHHVSLCAWQLFQTIHASETLIPVRIMEFVLSIVHMNRRVVCCLSRLVIAWFQTDKSKVLP